MRVEGHGAVAATSKNYDSHGVADGSNTRIVVLFPGALGDLLLAMPAIAELRRRHAPAHLTLAVNRALCALVVVSAVADAVERLDDAAAAGLFGGDRMPVWIAGHPHLYAWVGARDPALQARLRAVTTTAVFHGVVRGDGPEHAGDAYAGQVGAAPQAPRFRWPSPMPSPGVVDLLARLPRPILAIHPGAGAPAKRWPAAHFDAVARRWGAAGGGVCEIVGPADGDLDPIECASRVVEWSLPDVLALLASIDAYVGNDSGITHLAAAAGARGVALFGPTPARRWAPSGSSIAALQAPDSDSSDDGLAAIESHRVWKALGYGGCLDKLQGRT